MGNKNTLKILENLIDAVKEKTFENLEDYLERFLIHTAELFQTKQLLCINIQYLHNTNLTGKRNSFNKVNFSPVIIYENVGREKSVTSKINNIIALYSAMNSKNYSEKIFTEVPESVLSKKIILETNIIKNFNNNKPIEFSKISNKLKINVPYFYNKKNFDVYFNNISTLIKSNVKTQNDKLNITSRETLDNLANKLIKKKHKGQYLLGVHQLFRKRDVNKYIMQTKEYFRNNYAERLNFITTEEFNMYLEKAILRSFFTEHKFYYQIPVVNILTNKNYCDIGIVRIATKKPLTKSLFYAIHLAFNLTLEPLREFTVSDNTNRSNSPYKNGKNKTVNNKLSDFQIKLLTALRRNKFNVSKTTEILNSAVNRPLRRKTIVRYTKEIFLIYLTLNNYSLKKGIRQIAGVNNNKRFVAKKYKDYFLGHCGMLTVALTGSKSEKENVKKSLRIRYRKYFNYLENYCKENNVSISDWEKILSEYLDD